MYQSFILNTALILSSALVMILPINHSNIKSVTTLSDQRVIVKNPILAYKAIDNDMLALGLKAKPVNFIEAANVLQMEYFDPKNLLTSVLVQINNLDNHNCVGYNSFKEFENANADNEGAHNYAHQFDHKNSEIKIGMKSVYICISHYKNGTEVKNNFKAIYMEGKYIVTIIIIGKRNAPTDTFDAEKAMGQSVLEASLKITPNKPPTTNKK